MASYQVSRRRLVGAGGLLGLLATIAPTSLLRACAALQGRGAGATPGGRNHVVEFTPETVGLGVLDATRPDIVDIDPGDTVVYPNAWTHFLNRFQPGVPIQQLARWRRENPGTGPHSIIGPVGVKGARPGDRPGHAPPPQPGLPNRPAEHPEFLTRRAGLSRQDTYSPASLAVTFRVTQVVDVNQGVHAMIPKEVFAPDLRETMRVV